MQWKCPCEDTHKKCQNYRERCDPCCPNRPFRLLRHLLGMARLSYLPLKSRQAPLATHKLSVEMEIYHSNA